MRLTLRMCALLPLVLGVSSANARAEEPLSRVGVAVTVGGGAETFVDRAARAAAGPAATWDVRGTVGTRLIISSELAYFGSASSIQSVRGGRRATLISSGIELIVRVNLRVPGSWRPYAFAGRALRRYQVSDTGFTMDRTGVEPADDVLEAPLGIGCMLHRGNGLVIDARATLRVAAYPGLVTDATDTGLAAPMHTWSAGAHLGYEF
jgi:hypothetical protein